MKLKNSYILLIAMAIFLLVSIGSVCASENITTDSDNVLADADTDVALAGEDINGEDATQEKINTTIDTVDSAEFEYGDDKNITLNVKDNESSPIDINKSDLTVFEGNKALNFTYTNSVLGITDTLSVGNHSIIINFLGNANYTNSTKTVLFQILGNKTLEAPSTIVSDGTTVKIEDVKVFDGVKYIELTKDKFNITLTYVNETGGSNSVHIGDFDLNNGTLSFENDKKWVSASITLNYTDAINNVSSTIYLSTSVNATSETKVRDNEDKNITVKVYDNKGALLNITKSDLKVLDNGAEITAFTYNNTVITITNLAIGNHTITIIYNGNNTFYTSNTTATLNVFGNLTINPDKTAAVDENKNVNITLNLTDGVDLVDIDKEKLNITLFYTPGNQTLNRTVTKDDITIDGQNIVFAVPEIFDSAKVVIKYAAETNLTANVTIKVETKINCDDLIEKGETEVMNFTVTVTDNEGKLINLTSDNIKVYNGSKLLNTTYNNSTITINDKLTYGVYNLTVKFIGNDTLNDMAKDIVLKVYGIKLNATSVDVNSTKKGEIKFNITNGEENFNFTKDDINITVSYKNGNDTITVNVASWTLVNGTLSFELENANFTTATFNIKYNSTEANVTINRVYNVNIIPVTVSADYQDGNFTFKVVDIDDNNAPVAGKTVSVAMKKDGAQIYFITKSGSTYSINPSVTLTTDEKGIATLVNHNFYPGLVLSDNIYAPIGVYEATVTGSGVVKGNNKTNLTINEIDVKIALNPYSEYYGSDKKVVVTVTNAKTGKTVSGVYILLNITGATLSEPRQITDGNGTIQLGVTGLPTGSYSMSFKANDTNLKNSTGAGTFTIKKIPVTVNAKNVNVYYNTGTSYTFKVTKDGKALSGAYVLVRLYSTSKNYNDYLFLTNDKGQVSFSASLAVGKHKVIISSADTRYDFSPVTKTITVKKAEAKIKAKKVKTYYKGGQYLTVKVINKKTKTPIYAAKLNIKIFVSKTRYYNYNGSTGMNGKIKLALDNLKPGKYKVVVSDADNKNFTAKEVTTKIVIKKAPTKLTAKKLTAKKGEKKYFKVTAKNKKTKKAIPGIKLKVKVYTGKKSKTYTVKTDSKGVAKLSTAKLKVGNHKAVVSSANKYCSAKKAKSSIKITK